MLLVKHLELTITFQSNSFSILCRSKVIFCEKAVSFFVVSKIWEMTKDLILDEQKKSEHTSGSSQTMSSAMTCLLNYYWSPKSPSSAPCKSWLWGNWNWSGKKLFFIIFNLYNSMSRWRSVCERERERERVKDKFKKHFQKK